MAPPHGDDDYQIASAKTLLERYEEEARLPLARRTNFDSKLTLGAVWLGTARYC